MSIKIYFISAYLDYFLDNCVDYNEEQVECFNQDILIMEDRYQGNVTINILYDYCCSLNKGYKILQIEPNY